MAHLKLTEADHGRTLPVARGDILQLALGATAGTGYGWEVVACPAGLVRLSETIVPRAGSETLAGGPLDVVQEFEVNGEASCTGNLELHYRRPWESGTPPAKTLALSLVGKR